MKCAASQTILISHYGWSRSLAAGQPGLYGDACAESSMRPRGEEGTEEEEEEEGVKFSHAFQEGDSNLSLSRPRLTFLHPWVRAIIDPQRVHDVARLWSHAPQSPSLRGKIRRGKIFFSLSCSSFQAIGQRRDQSGCLSPSLLFITLAACGAQMLCKTDEWGVRFVEFKSQKKKKAPPSQTCLASTSHRRVKSHFDFQ